MLVGLAVVVIGALALGPMMFGDRHEPATLPVENQRGRTRSVPVTVPRGEPTQLRVSAWVRVRGAMALIGMCVGIGAFIALIAGAIVFYLGLKLQG